MTNKVCQLCYRKVKVTCDFIDLVIESQKGLEVRKNLAVAKQKKQRPSAPNSTSSLTPQEVVKKMHMSRGISIKKVVKPQQDEDDHVIVCSSPEPEVLLEEFVNDQYFDDQSADELVEVEDSDDDFNPSTSNNGSTGSKLKKAACVYINAPINFTCAKCKNSFETFEILSEHMKERSCVVEILKCNVCERVFDQKRTLYSHMRV